MDVELEGLGRLGSEKKLQELKVLEVLEVLEVPRVLKGEEVR